jgi:myo-inositol 2-dehydrogenase/D-chiro-inositol 1-dehydrogenase
MRRREFIALVHSATSRARAPTTFGYDQRMEAFGSTGMVRSNGLWPTAATRHEPESIARKDLLLFFIERYHEAEDRQRSPSLGKASVGNKLEI